MMVILGLLFSVVVFPAQAATPEKIEASIAAGLAWLADMQGGPGPENGDGSWSNWYSGTVAQTGFAVVKLEDRAYELGMSPFDPAYQYSQNVIDGLNYLFSQAVPVKISIQPAGNPDSEGDGSAIGIWFNYETYETGIAMMAIAASKDPARVVNVAGSAVNGWSYKKVLQNTVDYLAWGQCDAQSQCQGGWYYSPNAGWADQSNSGYAVLGLRYAEDFGCTIPAFVKSELNTWITYIQRPDGGSDYDGTWGQSSLLRTGNLLFEMAFVGDTVATPRVQNAIGYIQNNWVGGTDSQAMYCLMKGFLSLGINTITVGGNPVDWFDVFADLIIAEQKLPEGYWDTLGWSIDLDTVFCLLTLEKVVPPPAICEGRMTGGGSVFMKDGTRVTHGFELHCDIAQGPNNLEVNWGKGNKFHLENLKSASCSDDQNITPNPPPAGFDTYIGKGTGRYNGISGATIEFTFTDAGEPGKNDVAKMTIKDASGNVVLAVVGKLQSGNHQAHAK